MKRSLMSILAIVFPWIILLIEDNPGGALIALILQATGIGWPLASWWAWNIVRGKPKEKKKVIKST
jgi:hypothetical protein